MVRIVAALTALLLLPATVLARDYDVGPLHITQPWVRATPNTAPTAAGYLSVTNHGASPERLLGGSTTAASAIEPHTMSMAGGVMRMRLAANGYAIPPGATLTLAPGGDHLMIVGPKAPLRPGGHFSAVLRFAHAGPVRVEFEILDAAPAPAAAMPGMKMR